MLKELLKENKHEPASFATAGASDPANFHTR
jgi:hypothetical protein